MIAYEDTHPVDSACSTPNPDKNRRASAAHISASGHLLSLRRFAVSSTTSMV